MKSINGIETLKEILKIGKEIFETENKLTKIGIFGNDFVSLNFKFNIGEIVKKLINCPEEQGLEYLNYKNIPKDVEIICNDWVDELIFGFYDNELSLDELIEHLLKE